MLWRQSQDFDFLWGGALIAIIGIVFPIFALMGLGYLGRRLRLLTPEAAAALGGYVYYFSLPALLYVRLSEMPVAATNFIFAQQYGVAVEVTAAADRVAPLRLAPRNSCRRMHPDGRSP